MIAESYPITTCDLRLTSSETGFIVSRPVTGIFGSGDSPLSALRDYEVAVEEHREVEGP